MSEILDSGERREFSTGAVRDIQEGKGRCDLLPLLQIGVYLNDTVLISIANFISDRHADHLHSAIDEFIELRCEGDFYATMLDLAKHYEQGAKKYGERNWEKGIPLHCYIDSGVRHYLKCCAGRTDEPHDRAFIFNMFGALWTISNRPDLDDLPKMKERE